MPHILSVCNLWKSFSQGDIVIEILSDITISFVEGKSYALLGASGSGKSTFIQIIAGLDNPTRGIVSYDGTPMSQLTTQERASFLRTQVGLVFQKAYFINELSMIENVSLPALLMGTNKHDAISHARSLLNRVGLEGYEDYHPCALSGGQQQRAVIARALCNRPSFLIADEPTGSLDQKTATSIISLLLDCQKDWGMGLVISTHDAAIAQAAQYRFLLHSGHFTEGVIS